MDLQNLPHYPVQPKQGPQEKEDLPSRGENLSIVFEFSIGLALVNLLLLGLLLPFGVNPWLLVRLEAPLLFGVFGLLVVASRMSSLEQAATDSHEKDELGATLVLARLGGFALLGGAAIGIIVGIGLAAAVTHFFDYLRGLGRPIQGLMDTLFAGALIGALVGVVGGGGLSLAGGTPDWKVGRLFTALGRVIPELLRSCFPRRRGEIQLRGKPWVEGVVWIGFVGCPIVWFFW